MSGQDEPEYSYPLSSVPTLQLHNLATEPLGRITFNLQRTGFHKWGFVVYRCAYGNDNLWQRYVDKMKEKAILALDESGRKGLLKQYMDLTIIEDEQTLGNVSKDDVRIRFTDWAFERSDERDGVGASHLFSYRLPRFAYCLYVDQTCLNSLKAFEKFAAKGNKGKEPPITVVIVDAGFNKPKSGREPEVEGCTSRYVGWMYMEVEFIPSLYNRLHSQDLDDYDYIRPPKIYPQ
jgi:hypothetical protein